MIKTILSTTITTVLFAQTSFALTTQEYKSGVQPALTYQADLESRVKARYNYRSAEKSVRAVKGDIKRAARNFGIDPVHIVAVIMGEAAINVGFTDAAQNTAIRMFKGSQINKRPDTELYGLIHSSRYRKCESERSDYSYWYCVAGVWNGISGALNTENNVYKKFVNNFFNPSHIGTTFGLGQMNPLRAMMVDDMVSRNSGLPSLEFERTGNSNAAFSALLNDKKVVHYVAATIKVSIDQYRRIAKFDISQNPSITATLYNFGNERYHANKRYRLNLNRLGRGQDIEYPRPNKLGRWVLQNDDYLRSLLR